jgi:hypothetical protein
MELNLGPMLDEALHPTSFSVELPLLKLRYEDEHCLGGSKLNAASFFALSVLWALLFHSGELNNNVH